MPNPRPPVARVANLDAALSELHARRVRIVATSTGFRVRATLDEENRVAPPTYDSPELREAVTVAGHLALAVLWKADENVKRYAASGVPTLPELLATDEDGGRLYTGARDVWSFFDAWAGEPRTAYRAAWAWAIVGAPDGWNPPGLSSLANLAPALGIEPAAHEVDALTRYGVDAETARTACERALAETFALGIARGARAPGAPDIAARLHHAAGIFLIGDAARLCFTVLGMDPRELGERPELRTAAPTFTAAPLRAVAGMPLDPYPASGDRAPSRSAGVPDRRANRFDAMRREAGAEPTGSASQTPGDPTPEAPATAAAPERAPLRRVTLPTDSKDRP